MARTSLIVMLVVALLVLGACGHVNRHRCQDCNGSGTCYYCGGSGQGLIFACTICSESGLCPTCNGWGWTSR